eukprot:4567478-Pleurochrysis_carterae.AAC.1
MTCDRKYSDGEQQNVYVLSAGIDQHCAHFNRQDALACEAMLNLPLTAWRVSLSGSSAAARAEEEEASEAAEAEADAHEERQDEEPECSAGEGVYTLVHIECSEPQTLKVNLQDVETMEDLQARQPHALRFGRAFVSSARNWTPLPIQSQISEASFFVGYVLQNLVADVCEEAGIDDLDEMLMSYQTSSGKWKTVTRSVTMKKLKSTSALRLAPNTQ